MATKKTITSNTYTNNITTRHIVNKFTMSDVHYGISILRELNPEFNFANYAKTKTLLEDEFDCEVNIEHIERYFQPSFEAIAKDYNYLINMR